MSSEGGTFFCTHDEYLRTQTLRTNFLMRYSRDNLCSAVKLLTLQLFAYVYWILELRLGFFHEGERL